MNALAGGGSFVSLPALISVGVPSVAAGRRFDPLQGEHFPADQLQLGESFTVDPAASCRSSSQCFNTPACWFVSIPALCARHRLRIV